jgi:hypothetical protein
MGLALMRVRTFVVVIVSIMATSHHSVGAV